MRWIKELVGSYASRGALEKNGFLPTSHSGSTIVQSVTRLQEDKFYKQNVFSPVQNRNPEGVTSIY
jgi:zona occludens toxin (predicted ATPase)